MAKIHKCFFQKRIIKSLPLFSIIAPIYFLVISSVATIITPNYSAISDSYSVLARYGMPYSSLITVGFVGYALMIQALGALLYINAQSKSWGILLWILVFIYGLSGIFASIYRNASDTQIYWMLSEGSMHDLASKIGFFAILLTIILSVRVIDHAHNQLHWRIFSLAIACSTLAFAIPFGFRIFPNHLGVLQRGFFITIMIWIFVTALIYINEKDKPR